MYNNENYFEKLPYERGKFEYLENLKNQLGCHLKPNNLFIENVNLPVCPWTALKSSKHWTYFNQDVFWHIILKKGLLHWQITPHPSSKGLFLNYIFKKRLERLWQISEKNRYRGHLRFGIQHIPQKCAICMVLWTESTKLTKNM